MPSEKSGSLADELEEQYRLYRYFHATDDINSWEKEREERNRCELRIDALKAAIAAQAAEA